MIIDGNIHVHGVVVGSTASINSINAVQAISADAASATIGTVVFSNSNNVSFGLNNQTLTASTSGGAGGVLATVSMYPFPGWFGINTVTVISGSTSSSGGSTQTTGTMTIAPIILPAHVSYNEVNGVMNPIPVGGTGSATLGHAYGIYSATGATLSLLTSYIFNEMISQNGIANRSQYYYWGTNSTSNSSSTSGDNSSLFSGTRVFKLSTGGGSILAAGYFLGEMITKSISSTDIYNHNAVIITGSQTAIQSFIGQTGTTASGHLFYHGLVSTASNGPSTGANLMPATFNVSLISATAGTSQWRQPFIMFRTT